MNNLLQVIQGNLHFAQQRIVQGVSAASEIDEALRATERAAELTSHLLAVGRRQRVDSKRVDVGALVARSLRMLRRAIPESIQMDYEPPANHLELGRRLVKEYDIQSLTSCSTCHR